MKRIHYEYTSVEDALKIVFDEFGDKSMVAIELVLSQTPMYQGNLSEQWKFWNRVKEILAARMDEDVLALNALPRCQHGTALRDHSGATLYPSCGCTI